MSLENYEEKLYTKNKLLQYLCDYAVIKVVAEIIVTFILSEFNSVRVTDYLYSVKENIITTIHDNGIIGFNGLNGLIGSYPISQDTKNAFCDMDIVRKINMKLLSLISKNSNMHSYKYPYGTITNF